MSIYKAKGKALLILGPYRFYEEEYDFFFVAKDCVIRTATDKGGDAWLRFGKRLFLFDDMTEEDRVRLPYWDDIGNDPAPFIRTLSGGAKYIYSFKLNSADSAPVSFEIPAKFYTTDMPAAAPFLTGSFMDGPPGRVSAP